MMHRYARRFGILFVFAFTFAALSISAAVATASVADDTKAGLIALPLGEYDEAIRLFTRVLESGELSPEIRVIVLYNRGNAWTHKKDYDRAIVDYSEALRLTRGTRMPYITVAWRSSIKRGSDWPRPILPSGRN